MLIEARGERWGSPLKGPLSVTITRHYARRPLDEDNLVAASKLVLDAMQDASIICDDGPDTVKELTCKQVKVGTVKEERTEIILEPVQ